MGMQSQFTVMSPSFFQGWNNLGALEATRVEILVPDEQLISKSTVVRVWLEEMVLALTVLCPVRAPPSRNRLRGARLLYPDGRCGMGGVILGWRRSRSLPQVRVQDEQGYFGRAALHQS